MSTNRRMMRMPPKDIAPVNYRNSIASSITFSSAFSEQDADSTTTTSDTEMPPLLLGRQVISPLDPDSVNANGPKDKAPTRPARQVSVASSSVHGERRGEEEEEEEAEGTPQYANANDNAILESQLLPDTSAFTQVQIDSLQKELEEKQRVFQKAVQVRDRKYHLRTYKRCFVGSDAIDTMLVQGLASTREEAQTLGNHFLLNGLFRHVCGEHQFEDGHLFYRFLEDEDHRFTTCKRNSSSSGNSNGNGNVSGSNKNKIRWASLRTHTIQEEDSQEGASGSS